MQPGGPPRGGARSHMTLNHSLVPPSRCAPSVNKPQGAPAMCLFVCIYRSRHRTKPAEPLRDEDLGESTKSSIQTPCLFISLR